MMALRKAAKMNADYPLATKVIIEDSCLDDVLSSVDSIETVVERMQQVESVLEERGFKMK